MKKTLMTRTYSPITYSPLLHFLGTFHRRWRLREEEARSTLENDAMGPRWITTEPRAYYMNNIALSPKENAALWDTFKTAPVGSKVITTSVMVSVRDDASWQSKYDDVPLIALHSVSKGYAYKRGLVCYTRIA